MKLFRLMAVFFAWCVGGSTARAQTAPVAPAAPCVVVFAQDNFPAYGVSARVSPRQIVADLQAAGLNAELHNAVELADPQIVSAKTCVAVVLPYGNTYPQNAFANLRDFHAAGGSLVLSGIPFTHAAARRSAREWSATPDWGEAVQTAPAAGPSSKNAIAVHVGEERWTGITSPRFAVRPGETVVAQMEARETTRPGDNIAGGENREDHLYVRFFDDAGKQISQVSTKRLMPPTRNFQAAGETVTTPPRAASADMSVQMQRSGRRFLLAHFAATVAGKPVIFPNADFSLMGDVWLDTGHSDATALWGPQGIGVGGFDGPEKGEAGPVAVAPGDPLHLAGLGLTGENALSYASAQWLNPKSLPKNTRVVVGAGSAAQPVIALVVRTVGGRIGADAWMYRAPPNTDRTEWATEQLLARGTVAVLRARGILTPAAEAKAVRALDTLPLPPLYANLTLPAPPRTYTTFQPKMPAPASQLVVADVRGLSRDEKILLTSLQGLVNRTQPRLYLVFDDDDAFWLEETRKRGFTGAPLKLASPLDALTRFRADFKGAVIADPEVYTSAAVAASLAGADDLVMATPLLAQKLDLPIKEDLRGRFADNAAALRYLRESVLPRLDPYLTCCLAPDVFDRGALDQIIAARGSVFWVTGPKAVGRIPGANPAGEMTEIRALLASLPLGAVVRGFWAYGPEGVSLSEGEGVALGSRFGKITLVSDLINNLSVHSGVEIPVLKQKPRAPVPALDKTKVYLSFTMSDGDNLCTWRGYFRNYFNDPVRGSFPVGWGMGPSLLDVAPVWANWYYDQATPNDEFFSDVSGVGYVYPPSWATALTDRDAAFRVFYDQTEKYMARMDMHTLRLMEVRADDIARVGRLLAGTSYLLPDYGWAGGKAYPDFTYTLPESGQVVFRAVTGGRGPQHLAAQIRAYSGKTRPAFVNAFVWNWGSSLSDLKKTLELLGPEYVAVLPSHLNTLYRRAQDGKRQ